MPDFLNLKKQNLKYLDALTYAAIRSFYNPAIGYCYPPYEKIMELSGLSRGFVADSIKRLKAAGLITIIHSKREGTCNRYSFTDIERFERIPYELFDASDLTVYEKALLLCLRQFFNHGSLTTLYTITQISGFLGLSYSQVYKPYKSLIAKDYIVEIPIMNRYRVEYYTKVMFSSKIDWNYIFVNKNVRDVTVPLDYSTVKLKVA